MAVAFKVQALGVAPQRPALRWKRTLKNTSDLCQQIEARTVHLDRTKPLLDTMDARHQLLVEIAELVIQIFQAWHTILSLAVARQQDRKRSETGGDVVCGEKHG